MYDERNSLAAVIIFVKYTRKDKMMAEFETIILRFRDLVTKNGYTIENHKKTIEEKGHVWWGWWNKGNEKTPFAEFSILRGEIGETPIQFFLMDSGQEKLYKAKCTDMRYYKSEKKPSPDQERTPDYYNNQAYYAWFQFEEIRECKAEEIRQFTCIQVDSLFVENRSNYDKFYGKRIYSIKELIQQNRTIWFIRKFDEKRDGDYEIKLLNANVVEPRNFSDRYFETGSDTLLWLSDLHFGDTNVFPVKMEKETDVTLTAHIKNAYENLNDLGGLIITGDITSYGKEKGFDIATDFLTDLNRNLSRKLTSENIIFCPGNHDLGRKEQELGSGVPEKVCINRDSTKAYSGFYYSVHNINPNEYLACGRKLLMSSGRTVEIAALNSLILQQYRDFEGHGFLSNDQLEYAAEQMGWNQNSKTNAVRIVMMHHHYLPACFVEQVDVKKPGSVVYDAERFMQWMIKYNIKILLHGHKHQSFIAKVGRAPSSEGSIDMWNLPEVNVIGMGGTGACGCENKFATLTFEPNKVVLKFYRIFAGDMEADRCVQTVNIAL